MYEMISINSRGSFDKTEAFLNKMKSDVIFARLDGYGREGVAALAKATPVETGLTAASWRHEVIHESGRWKLRFYNDNTAAGKPVAILLQYGHGTGTGGYVVGRDYINPVIRPLFDKIADDVWKAVTSA